MMSERIHTSYEPLDATKHHVINADARDLYMLLRKAHTLGENGQELCSENLRGFSAQLFREIAKRVLP